MFHLFTCRRNADGCVCFHLFTCRRNAGGCVCFSYTVITEPTCLPVAVMQVLCVFLHQVSFVISMLGVPQIVLLDEPSTGMDPQSKRFFW